MRRRAKYRCPHARQQIGEGRICRHSSNTLSLSESLSLRVALFIVINQTFMRRMPICTGTGLLSVVSIIHHLPCDKRACCAECSCFSSPCNRNCTRSDHFHQARMHAFNETYNLILTNPKMTVILCCMALLVSPNAAHAKALHRLSRQFVSPPTVEGWGRLAFARARAQTDRERERERGGGGGGQGGCMPKHS